MGISCEAQKKGWVPEGMILGQKRVGAREDETGIELVRLERFMKNYTFNQKLCPPTNILAVRDSQEDTPHRRATYSEFPPSSLCADHGLRKSETRAFTHTNQFVRSWLFLTCFM